MMRYFTIPPRAFQGFLCSLSFFVRGGPRKRRAQGLSASARINAPPRRISCSTGVSDLFGLRHKAGDFLQLLQNGQPFAAAYLRGAAAGGRILFYPAADAGVLVVCSVRGLPANGRYALWLQQIGRPPCDAGLPVLFAGRDGNASCAAVTDGLKPAALLDACITLCAEEKRPAALPGAKGTLAGGTVVRTRLPRAYSSLRYFSGDIPYSFLNALENTSGSR